MNSICYYLMSNSINELSHIYKKKLYISISIRDIQIDVITLFQFFSHGNTFPLSYKWAWSTSQSLLYEVGLDNKHQLNMVIRQMGKN